MRALLCALAAAAALALAGSRPSLAQTAPGTRIVSVATCEYSLAAGSGSIVAPVRVRVRSNAVETPVMALDAFDDLRLEVSPAGIVEPGATLTYTLSARNVSGVPLNTVWLRIPLDADLSRPTFVGTSPTSGVAPSLATYDDPTQTLLWTFATIPVEARFAVVFEARVKLDTPSDSLVTEQGAATAVELVGAIESNVVSTPVVAPLLRVALRPDRAVAVPGDTVVWSAEVQNTSRLLTLRETVDAFELPPGLALLSARLGAPASSPEDAASAPTEPVAATPSAGGREVSVDVGALGPGQTRIVRFATRVGAGARRGEALARTRADARTPNGFATGSNVAAAGLRIEPGPFRQEAILSGRVFVDDDGDGVPSAAEPGVPGVLVALEDGRGAVTDVSGRWHVEAVRPGLHVARIDRASLAETLIPLDGGADWGGDRGSRFADVRPGTLAIVDFPVGPPLAARCRIEAGAVALSLPVASLLDAAGGLLPSATGHLEQAAQRAVEGGVRQATVASVTCPADATPAAATLERLLRAMIAKRSVSLVPAVDAEEAAAPDRDSLEQVVREASAAVAILSPADGAVAARSSIAVEVVYPAGSVPELRVNGEPIPPSRIGSTSTLPSRGVSASRYVGVPLVTGRNRLTFGAPPEAAQVETWVVLPGPVAALVVAAPEGAWVADATSPRRLRVEAVDGAGMRVAESPLVTIDVEGASPLAADADSTAEGYQVLLRDGSASIAFAPATAPGRVRAAARWERVETETIVDVLPGGGGWRIVGLAEGRVAADAGVEGDGGLPPGIVDDVRGSEARLALHARGPVGRNGRLTVSLDTERERDRDRLFGSSEPDRFFPVHGDTSTPVEEAERQGPFYARLDGPRGHAILGDVETGFERTELARYDRRLPGLAGRAVFGRAAVEGFAAPTEQTVVRDVFAPDGTSGPYLLSRRPLVARSERIVVEVRDRFRTDEVLSRQAKLADLDYDLDPEAGTILFRGPVAPFDRDLNPLRVVVVYEIRNPGTRETAAGIRVSFAPRETIDGGVTVLREGRVGSDLSIVGADLAWRPRPGTSVRAEIATSDEGETDATASRVEVRSRAGATLGWEVTWRDLPENFANPTLLGTPEIGSRRLGGSVLWEPGEAWRVKGEAFRQEDRGVDLTRTVAGVEAERRFARLSTLFGIRSVAAEGATIDVASTIAEAGVRGRLAERWIGEVSRRQVLGGETAPGYPTRTGAALSWEVAPGRRLVLRHEIEDGDGPDRARTSLGVESALGTTTKALVRYELADGERGASLRSTAGIETSLPLGHGSSVHLSAARRDTARGEDDADFTTLSAGWERTAGDTVLTARYEISLAPRENRHLATLSGVFRAADPWTLFVRERLFLSDSAGPGSAGRAEGLVGIAYRPAGRPWQALIRLEHLQAGGGTNAPGGLVPGGVLSEPASSLGGPPAASAPPGVGTRSDRGIDAPDGFSLSVAAGGRLTARQRVAATLVARYLGTDAAAGVGSSLTHLVSLHYTTAIHRRWTLGASARRMTQRETGTATYGTGMEVGLLALRNVWIAGGYNFTGFRDGALADEDRTERGPFLALRFKFDENSLQSLRDLRLDR